MIREGYQQTAIGLIPCNWEAVNLGDIGECIIGLTYKPENVKESGLLVLRSSNIKENTLRFDDNVFVDIEVSERIKTQEGDILVCVRNGSRNLIGKTAIIDSNSEGLTFGAFMSVYRTKYFNYIFHLFQSNILKRQIQNNLGATINQITNKDLNSFIIPLPPLPEQKAIAEVLGDVDRLINACDKLIAKKRDIKQGAMQELLTGRSRLPGFSGEWGVKKVGDLAEFSGGSQPPRSCFYFSPKQGYIRLI